MAGGCEEGRADALDQLDEIGPDLVIGSAHQDAFGGILVPPGQPDIHNTYVQGLLDVADRVEAAGARFVLLGPAPLGPNPLGCGGPLQHPDDCLGSTFGNFDATTYAFSDAAQRGGLGFINTTPWFCVDTRCPIFAAGRLVRFDDAHLTRQFATYLAPLLREVLDLELLAAQEDGTDSETLPGMSACVFCQIVAGELPGHLVLETDDLVAFLDTRPVFKGHVLLVPREHVDTLPDLPAELRDPFLEAAQRLAAAVTEALGAQGSFVAINNTVSQSVPHLHLHVVPRTKGDGLRGFFWPRTKYADGEAAAYAEKLREALAS